MKWINCDGAARRVQWLFFASLFALATTSIAYAQDPYQRLVRKFELPELGISNPAGLAYSPAAGALLVATSPGATTLRPVTFAPDLADEVTLTAVLTDPVNMAFDARANSLLFWDVTAGELVEIEAGADGRPQSAPTRFNAQTFGFGGARGLAVDPQTGHLFALIVPAKPAIPRIVSIVPHPQNRFAGSRVSSVALSALQHEELRGIAFNPADGHLYVLSASTHKLYELNLEGAILSARDLSQFELRGVRNMVFAPSGDKTDDPGIMNLYLAASGLDTPAAGQTILMAAGASGDIAELSLTAPEVLDLSTVTVQTTLVQTIHTSQWSPSSPDPAGIAYFPPSNGLLISDSEVDEMSIFTGVNYWQATLTGGQVQEFGTASFSDEPSGVAYNPNNGHLFFSDDRGVRRVYELNPGPDGLYDTSDDIVTSIRTNAFLSDDPEGIAYDTDEGHLFIADGSNAEIFEVDPGANGIFDGVPPAGDDVVDHFDTSVLGLNDPEGVEFNPDTGTLYIVSRDDDFIVETTRDGTPIRVIDIAFLAGSKLAGVAYAPSSANPFGKSLYLVDRGVDNDIDPNENDGKIYEISLESPIPGIAIDDVTVQEGDAGMVDAVFTVTLSGVSSQFVTVDFITIDSSATTADNDYLSTSGQVVFQPGETTRPISISVNGDTAEELDEIFFVELANAANGVIVDNQGQGTITNDDQVVSLPLLSIEDVSAGEEAGVLTFVVNLSAPTMQPVTVDYATSDSTAQAGSDYTAASGMLTIPVDSISGLITVVITDDAISEPAEFFTLQLTNAVGATFADSLGLGTIIDNEDLPSLSVNDVSISEGANTLVFIVTMSSVSAQAVTVDYATSDSTAIAGSDYTAASGTLTIPVDSTTGRITVAITDDALDESSEVFKLQLSGPSGATLADGLGLGTIADDDDSGGEPVTVSFQNGVNGYSGTRDVELDSNLPTTNFGSATVLKLDGTPSRSVLLAWDVSSIPSSGTVESVEISFNVTNASVDTYEFYEMLRPWVESEATWNQYAAGQSWQAPGAAGSSDRGTTVLGTITGPKGLTMISLNAAGVAVVQAWVDDAASNRGLVILDHISASDELDLSTRENSSDWKRPKLTVTYSVPGGASKANIGVPALAVEELPQELALHPNYPNPFSQETSIEYALPEPASVRLMVYNIRGQLVRTLVDEPQPAGMKRIRWNGTDDAGRAVGSGVYLLRMMVDRQQFTGKIILMK